MTGGAHDTPEPLAPDTPEDVLRVADAAYPPGSRRAQTMTGMLVRALAYQLREALKARAGEFEHWAVEAGGAASRVVEAPTLREAIDARRAAAAGPARAGEGAG